MNKFDLKESYVKNQIFENFNKLIDQEEELEILISFFARLEKKYFCYLLMQDLKHNDLKNQTRLKILINDMNDQAVISNNSEISESTNHLSIETDHGQDMVESAANATTSKKSYENGRRLPYCNEINEEFKIKFWKSTDFKFYSIGLNQIISVKDSQIQLDNVDKDCYRSKDSNCLICPAMVFISYQYHRPCIRECSNFYKFKVHLLKVAENYNRKLIFLDENQYIPEADFLRRERELTDISPFVRSKFKVLNKQNKWMIMDKGINIKCNLLHCKEIKCRSVLYVSKREFLLHLKRVERKSGCYLVKDAYDNQDNNSATNGNISDQLNYENSSDSIINESSRLENVDKLNSSSYNLRKIARINTNVYKE